MKTMDKICAQGEILIRRIDKLPNKVKAVPSINGRVIVAHSETGHHHYFEEPQLTEIEPSLLDEMLEESQATQNITDVLQETADRASVILWVTVDNPEISYLEVKGKSADLIHAREWKTHETIRFPPGIYQINHQQQMSPAGWTRVLD